MAWRTRPPAAIRAMVSPTRSVPRQRSSGRRCVPSESRSGANKSPLRAKARTRWNDPRPHRRERAPVPLRVRCSPSTCAGHGAAASGAARARDDAGPTRFIYRPQAEPRAFTQSLYRTRSHSTSRGTTMMLQGGRPHRCAQRRAATCACVCLCVRAHNMRKRGSNSHARAHRLCTGGRACVCEPECILGNGASAHRR